MVLPGWLNSKFAWNLAPGFGLGVYLIVPLGLIILGVVTMLVSFEENMHRKNPPRCCRSAVTVNGYECEYAEVASKTISQ